MTLLLRRGQVSVVLGLCIIVNFGAAQNSNDTYGTCSQGSFGNNTFQLSGFNRTFSSPNYPAKYKSNTTCIWIISVPEGKRVILRFDSGFEVPDYYSYPLCRDLDFVEMRDGNSSTDRVLGIYCGYGPHNDVQSTGNFMWIKFFSNHNNVTGTGFEAHYEAVEAVEVACTYSGWTYDASLLYNQTLTSSNYPFLLDNVADCSGTFRTSSPSGYIVKILFKYDFHLGYVSYCKHADTYIQFFDGPTSSSPAIGTFCQYNFPEVVYSTGRYLHMKFVGKSDLRYKGFSFNYSAVLADETSGMCLPNKQINYNLQLSGPSGTFFTPNYPVNYKKDTRCIWIISAPAGKRIRLTFLYGFHVSSYSNPSCRKDYVEVRDGSSFTSRKLGKYCGSNPGFVESSGNFLWVKFRSNSDDENGAGFKARYTAVEGVVVACTYSGWTYDASALHNQTLTSSHYPVYAKDKYCSGTIRTSDVTGYVVKIVFNDFVLETNKRKRCYLYTEVVYLELYDGPSSSSKLIGSFCGDTFPEVVYSSGRYLHINYVAARHVTGFSFNYTAVPEDEASGICSPSKDTNDNIQLSGSSGTFFSPNYPVPFKHGTTCIWIISAPVGKRIRLNFTEFHLPLFDRPECSEDFVEIRDGISSTSTELGKFCGHIWRETVESTGNYLRVMLHANRGFHDYAGFKAKYQTIDSSKNYSNKYPEIKDEASESNVIIVRVVVGVAVFIFIIVIVSCVAVHLRKKNRRPRETEEVIPLRPTNTMSVSQSTPATLPTSVAALQGQSLLSDEDRPPPYPEASPASQGEGEDTVPSVAFQGQEEPPPPYLSDVPQYPPPGELYPWQQSLKDGSQASSPTENRVETTL